MVDPARTRHSRALALGVSRQRTGSSSPPRQLLLRIARRDGVAVLGVSGRLGIGGTEPLATLLRDLLAEEPGSLVCDLTDLDYVSPRVVTFLLRALSERPPQPPPLVICGASGQPARVFAALDPERTTPAYPTVDEALRHQVSRVQRADLALPGDVRSAGRARDFTRGVCAVWGLGAVRDDVAVVVSELVTEVVSRPRAPGRVTLECWRDTLTVSVAGAPGADVLPRQRTRGSHPVGGRAPHLVRMLTRAAGSYVQPTGRTVWGSLQLPAGASH